MSPLGRKVGLGVLIVIALFIFVKTHDSHIKEQGRQEGVKATVLSTEKQLKASWATADSKLAAIQKDLDAAGVELKKAHDDLINNQQKLQQTIKEDDVRFKTRLNIVIPQQVEAMTPEAVQEELDKTVPSPTDVLIVIKQNEMYQEALAVRSRQIDGLIDASVNQEANSVRQLVNQTKKTELAEKKLATMTEERDFYRAEVKVLTDKHMNPVKCGLKKIFTLGIGRCTSK